MEFHHLKEHLRFWQMNMKATSAVKRKLLPQKLGELTLAPGQAKHLKEIAALHQRLYHLPFLGWLYWLYRFRASRLITVALDRNGQVVGYECFMVNESELGQDILHSVYLGVAESHQGQGLAAALRRYSVESFNHGNVAALSTVVPVGAMKAMRSAQKAGYAIEKASLKPPGYYLVRHLSAA